MRCERYAPRVTLTRAQSSIGRHINTHDHRRRAKGGLALANLNLLPIIVFTVFMTMCINHMTLLPPGKARKARPVCSRPQDSHLAAFEGREWYRQKWSRLSEWK